MRESIGNAYGDAIGQTYFDSSHAISMAKERSVLERAMEALREKHPRVKPTQERLASLAGVKQPSVNEWKDKSPSMDTAIRLAKSLDICVEWLLTERGPKHVPDVPKDPLLAVWPQLDDAKKAQLTRFADFIKNEK
jgi:DNA-binding XRE family transcriptional regulator